MFRTDRVHRSTLCAHAATSAKTCGAYTFAGKILVPLWAPLPKMPLVLRVLWAANFSGSNDPLTA